MWQPGSPNLGKPQVCLHQLEDVLHLILQRILDVEYWLQRGQLVKLVQCSSNPSSTFLITSSSSTTNRTSITN